MIDRHRPLGLEHAVEPLQGTSWCPPGCSACESACPADVDLAEVLRTRIYAVDDRDQALALEDDAKRGQGAGTCLGCAHPARLGACSCDVRILTLTRDAAIRLG